MNGARPRSAPPGTLVGATMSGNFNVAPPPSSRQPRHDIHGGTTTFAGVGGTAYVGGTGTGALRSRPRATWSGSFGIYGQGSGAGVLNQGTSIHTGGSNTSTARELRGTRSRIRHREQQWRRHAQRGLRRHGQRGRHGHDNGEWRRHSRRLRVGLVANNGGTLEANGDTSTLTLGTGNHDLDEYRDNPRRKRRHGGPEGLPRPT